MESNGKGMSAKGTALAGLGLRYPPHSSGCRNRIKRECPKVARNGALELTKRRGKGFVHSEIETPLRGFKRFQGHAGLFKQIDDDAGGFKTAVETLKACGNGITLGKPYVSV